ncbi:hypothetical protein FBR04_07500 [Betaproteobacteria bacterium PRO7]|jgi:hypothetical protein|nr:hypothetical protein [Betaproteobacteria bacterium PRO7]
MHADPTFAAVAARLDREPAGEIELPRHGDAMPVLGERLRMATGRTARYVGPMTDPHDNRTLCCVAFDGGGEALFERRTLLRVLRAAEQRPAKL